MFVDRIIFSVSTNTRISVETLKCIFGCMIRFIAGADKIDTHLGDLYFHLLVIPSIPFIDGS